VSSDYFANTPILGVNLNERQLQSYGLTNLNVEQLLQKPSPSCDAATKTFTSQYADWLSHEVEWGMLNRPDTLAVHTQHNLRGRDILMILDHICRSGE
jgi:hypothetical protein